MMKFLLWALLIYFAWRVIRSFIKIYSNSGSRRERKPPFDNIEEADYEDLTQKDDPDKKEHPPEDKQPGL